MSRSRSTASRPTLVKTKGRGRRHGAGRAGDLLDGVPSSDIVRAGAGSSDGVRVKNSMASTRELLPKEAQVWQDLAEQVQSAWRQGDYDDAGQSFLELQQRSTSWLLAIARRKAPPGRAEELVAQAHHDLLALIEAGKPTTNVKGLLGTILRRRIVDAYRRGAGVATESADDAFWERHAESASDEDNLQEQVERRETARGVANAILDALPSPEREVLIARHIDQLTVVETAARLGLTEDQVKKRRQDAVALARRITKEQGLL